MKNFYIALLVLSLAVLACGAGSQNSTDRYMKEYGGNPDIYSRILTLTDCEALQSELDQAEANLQEPGTEKYKWGIGYMKAADDRMKEISCYK